MNGLDWNVAMELALTEARAAAGHGDVPVGAVLVDSSGAIVAADHNRREERSDPTAHAEIVAIREACQELGSFSLEGCEIYSSCEPCPMCLQACRQARIDLIVWGAPDPVMGACGSAVDAAEDPQTPPPIAHRGGLLAEDSKNLLREFFANRRKSS